MTGKKALPLICLTNYTTVQIHLTKSANFGSLKEGMPRNYTNLSKHKRCWDIQQDIKR